MRTESLIWWPKAEGDVTDFSSVEVKYRSH
jgi:hypothetical protein